MMDIKIFVDTDADIRFIRRKEDLATHVEGNGEMEMRNC